MFVNEGYGVSTASSISLPASVAAESTDEDEDDDDDDDDNDHESTVKRCLQSDDTAAVHRTANSFCKLQSPADYRYHVAVTWSIKTSQSSVTLAKLECLTDQKLSVCLYVCLCVCVLTRAAEIITARRILVIIHGDLDISPPPGCFSSNNSRGTFSPDSFSWTSLPKHSSPDNSREIPKKIPLPGQAPSGHSPWTIHPGHFPFPVCVPVQLTVTAHGLPVSSAGWLS